MFLINLVIGAVLGWISIITWRNILPQYERVGWGVGLIIAALIYVAFLAMGGDGNWLWIEPMGVAIYTPIALLGIFKVPVAIGVGWLLHGIWDVALHSGDHTHHFVPYWYPAMCLGYDMVVGVYLIQQSKHWKMKKREENQHED